MDGEGNNDTIIGSDLADTLIGGEGRDRVFGGLGDDLILAAGNNDRLFGEGGDDRLNAGKGFDFLDGGSGGDVCDGGAHDLPDDKFDSSCERVENRPRLKRGERRVKSRIKLTALRRSGAKGKVTSASAGCEGADRKIRLQRYEDFITGLVATTTTNDRGRWRIRRSLRSGCDFAEVDGGSGRRYDVSRNRATVRTGANPAPEAIGAGLGHGLELTLKCGEGSFDARGYGCNVLSLARRRHRGTAGEGSPTSRRSIRPANNATP